MMHDAQPLTDADLARMDRELTDAYERDGEWYLTTDAPRDMRRLLAEVERLRSALTALARNEQAAANRSLEMQEENSALLRKLEEQYRRRAQNVQELHVIRVSADMYDKGDNPLTLTLRHDGESLGTRIAELLSVAQHDRNAAVGVTVSHLAKIERLQSERDALVRKLGLDWGPDEFGDLSKVPDRAEQINAVVSLHQPTAMNSWGHRTCIECDTPGYYQEWPCPTLVALGFEER